MPSFERGVYEPPNDDIRVFDDDEQDVDEEGSRLPLLIVIALLVLAAFGGVVYLAWSQGVERGRADAPRMIVAAPGPSKEAANDTSGAQTHSLKIYEQPAPVDDSSDDGVPPPPTVAAKPAPTPVVTAAPSKPAAVVPETSKPAPIVAATPKPAVVAPKPAVVAEKPAPKPAPVVTQTTSAPPTPIVAPPKPVEAAPKPEASASSGAYELQIGAYKSQDDADAAWKVYKSKHPSAAAYSEDVHKADLGDKGIWYRLRIGPFSGKADANGACDKLKADGGACMLAK
jgi:cell division septation protein DedD